MVEEPVKTEKESVLIFAREGVELDVQARRHHLVVDQPVEEGGKDRGMTPTELFAGSLGACIAYFAVRFCQRHHQSTDGLRVSMEWDYKEQPHRIGSIRAQVDLPKGWNPDLNDRFHKVLEGCTIHQSLKFEPDIAITLQ